MRKKYLAGIFAAALIFTSVPSTSYVLGTMESVSVDIIEQNEKDGEILNSSDLEQADQTESEEFGGTADADESIESNEDTKNKSEIDPDNQPEKEISVLKDVEMPEAQSKDDEISATQVQGGEVSAAQSQGEEAYQSDQSGLK